MRRADDSAAPGPEPIPIARPWLGPEEEEALTAALRTRWVGQGPRVADFETRLAARLGAPHAVAVSSGTAALHLGLLAADLGPGHEVIVPGLSFIATANAVRMTGAEPIFADVDPETYNLDPADAAQRITPATRAILVVHQLGLPADLGALGRLTRKHNLLLLEDAACALGSRLGSDPIGRPHGALCCFSFHPRKVITTGEGGAVTTADDVLAARVRQLRNHGAANGPDGAAEPSYVELGYNYRLSDLHAAVGLIQLDRLDEILARRRALAALYDARLGRHPGIQIPHVPDGCTPNYQSYMLVVGDAHDPQALAETLASQGIATRSGLTAMHLEPAFADRRPAPALPHCERLSRRGLFLPLYPELTEEQAARVCDALLRALDE